MLEYALDSVLSSNYLGTVVILFSRFKVAAAGVCLCAAGLLGADELDKQHSLAIEAAKQESAPAATAGPSGLESEIRSGPRSSVANESEPNDQPSSADVISPAISVAAGSISPSGDVDYYSITVAPESRAFISIDGTDATLANGDSFLEIRAADGLTVLESDDDDGPVNLSSGIAGARLSAGGIYYVRVAALGSGLDPYFLFLNVVRNNPADESEPNDSAAAANPAEDLNAGTLGAGDNDWFRFEALAGDLILIAVDPNPDRLGSTLDPSLEIYSPTGGLIGTQDINGAGQPEFTNLALAPTDGTYTVRLRSAAGGGSYLMSIQARRFLVPVELLDFQASPG